MLVGVGQPADVPETEPAPVIVSNRPCSTVWGKHVLGSHRSGHCEQQAVQHCVGETLYDGRGRTKREHKWSAKASLSLTLHELA